VAKQRDAVRMSDAEVAAFLAESRSLNVATLDKDGAPHLTTLWFALSEGRPIFETYRASQKVVNLRRGVSITGRAEIVEENPRLEALMRLLVEGNHPGLSEAQLVATTAQMVRKRVVVIVHPDKVMSWDHRKLPPPAGGG
jgi:hypothetical protein